MSRKERIIFGAILAGCALYSGVYIYRTSFTLDGQRFFSLFDDAMISMRYARNLASGNGLVWNPGSAPVEGITNPLWTAYMAVLHLLPIPETWVSLPVQLTGAVCLLLAIVKTREVAEGLGAQGALVALIACALTAFYNPLLIWSLQGMEVSVLTLLVMWALSAQIRATEEGGVSRLPYILGTIAVLVRMDAAVPFVAMAATSAFLLPNRRGFHLKAAALSVAAPLFLLTAFRLLYYGDWLPNTYYLKLTGFPPLARMVSGLWSFLGFVTASGWVITAGFLSSVAFTRAPRLLYPYILFLSLASYSIYTGGDAWDTHGLTGRALCQGMPAFFVGFSFALVEIARRTFGRLQPVWAFVLLALASYHLNFRHPDRAREWLFQEKPFYAITNRNQVVQAVSLKRFTHEGASVAVVWAGTIPYFCERHYVDILGKNDRVIGKGEARILEGRNILNGFYPGHLKWDYGYSVGTLKPDVVTRLWRPTEEVYRLLSKDYWRVEIGNAPYYLRKGSEQIRWENFDLSSVEDR